MKILVLSRDAWINEKPFGNTLSNWFGGNEWENDRFQNIYTRADTPNNGIIERSYRIPVMGILKNVLIPGRIGEIIEREAASTDDAELGQKNPSSERKTIDAFKKVRSRGLQELAYFAVERIYHSKIWKNKKFKQFIRGFSPNIVFTYLGDDGFIRPIIEYITDTTQAKVVLVASDDVYGFSQKASWLRKRALEKNLKWVVAKADYLYGQSEELCAHYQAVFGKTFHVIYKGCDLDFEIKEKDNSPKRIVYAGNLLYGRDETLCEVAKALKRINENGIKALLEIYTTTPVRAEASLLNDPMCSCVKGTRSYSEIVRIMRSSDVVLYVESFDPDQIEHVKYSFSTKIMDCLQSGAAAMAIGPAGNAAIEYFKRIDGAITLTDLNGIENTMWELLCANDLRERAERIHRFAVTHHELHTVRENLRNDFVRLLSE